MALKKNRNTKFTKRHLRKNKKSVSESANQVLLVLWCCTFLLLAFMILRWNENIDFAPGSKQKKQSIFFVDDVLLSSADLKLNTTSSLINISLNSEPAPPRSGKKEPLQANPITRSELYNNIFNQKIKKAENKPSRGFAMKPLPE